tara:strand:+ start:1028 stop:1777 length:750 start_codon:yes stop_codon:yes gene_type:complete
MTSALGIIASGHKFAAAALTLSFNARTYDEDTTGAAIEDDTRTLTTSLSTGSAGDLAILCERRINGKSTTVPAANLNTGWTLIGTGPTNAGNEFRLDLSYKIMTASDISSGSVTTGQSEVQQNTILFFTPSQAITSVSSYGFIYAATSGTHANQTQSVTSSGASAPVIVFGIKTTHAGGSHPRPATFGTVSWDADFYESTNRQDGDLEIQNDASRVGYIIQNSTLSDVTISYTDEGANQQASSFHLSVA